MTTGSQLARNSFFNLLGQGLPLVAAVVAIPILIRGLGTDRFGVLTLAWMVIGYFSLFDLGLGRALTQVVAESLSEKKGDQAPPVVWAALALMFTLGLVGSFVVILVSPWLVYSGLNVPDGLRFETLRAFYLLAIAIPLVVVSAGLVGILAAFQRFGTINAIRAPMALFSLIGPLAVLPFSSSLVPVTVVLVVGRSLACAANLVACRHLMPPLRHGVVAKYGEIRPLFRIGAWMSVTNLIGPLMVYLDRFVIGGILSVAAVAYYATPYELVTKLLFVPGAVLSVLFPAFAATHKQDRPRTLRLFTRGTKYIALVMFPVILSITAFAPEGLQLWLGDEFARQSAPVLRCLAIGVFINSIAQVSFTLLQGIGRADLSAKLHLLELPIYLPALWWGINNHGILGAAIVWTGRVTVDGALLLWLFSRSYGDNRWLLKRMALGLTAAIGALVTPLLVSDTAYRGVTVLLILIVFLQLAWANVLAEDERTVVKGRLSGLRLL